MNVCQKLVAALEGLTKKELGVRRMYNSETKCFCATGAMQAATGNGALRHSASAAAHVIGVTAQEVSVIVDINDGFDGTNAERYAHMLAYGKANS